MIKFHNVVKSKDNINILDDISFDVKAGSVAVLQDSNESVISAIVDAISGRDKVDDGKIVVGDFTVSSLKGASLRAYKTSISLICESSIINRRDTVFENVSMPLLGKTLSKEDITKRVNDALSETGILNIATSNCLKLSSYISLLLKLSKAIVKQAKLFILKEPFLKLTNQESISLISLLQRIHEKYKITILIASCDNGLLSKLSDKLQINLIKIQKEKHTEPLVLPKEKNEQVKSQAVEFVICNYLVLDGLKKESIYNLITSALHLSFNFSGRIIYESEKNIKEEFLLSVVNEDELKVAEFLNKSKINCNCSDPLGS